MPLFSLIVGSRNWELVGYSLNICTENLNFSLQTKKKEVVRCADI